MSSGRITISVSFYLFPFVLIASRYQDYGNGEGVANTIYVSLELVMWIIRGDRSAPFNRLLREARGGEIMQN